MTSIFCRRLCSNRVALLHAALLLTLFTLPTIAWAQSGALEFIPVTQCRLADTRNPTGPFGGPILAGNTTRSFNIPQSACGIPSTAVAYSLNVTAEPTGLLDYLTMWPDGMLMPFVSILNSYREMGRIKANAAITAAGPDGAVDVYVRRESNITLDINGYFVPGGTSSSSLQFFPVTPCRVADTRTAAGPLGGPSLTGGVLRKFPVRSTSCGIPATARAYSLNITALPLAAQLTYLVAWPTGQAQPGVSTLNAPTGTATANAAIVAAGLVGNVSLLATDTTDVLIDVNGYFAPPATGGLSLYTVPECRVLDTRSGAGAFNGTLVVPVQGSSCAPPAAAQAYVLNATVVPLYLEPLDYLTVWADGTAQPGTSTLNSLDWATDSNMAIVSTTAVQGNVSVFASGRTQLIIDIFGYFAP